MADPGVWRVEAGAVIEAGVRSGWHRVWLAICVLCLMACGRNEESDFLPMAAPGFWHYGLTAKTELTLKTAAQVRRSKYTVLGLEPVRIDGRTLAQVQINGGLRYFFEHWGEGVRRVAIQAVDESEPRFDPEPRVVLPERLAPGTRWQSSTVTAMLETVVDPFRRQYRLQVPILLDYEVVAHEVSVTVPAGTFNHCLRIDSRGKTRFRGDKTLFPTDVEVIQTDWYAPGIGLVRSARVETTGTNLLPRGELVTELELYRR